MMKLKVPTGTQLYVLNRPYQVKAAALAPGINSRG